MDRAAFDGSSKHRELNELHISEIDKMREVRFRVRFSETFSVFVRRDACNLVAPASPSQEPPATRGPSSGGKPLG